MLEREKREKKIVWSDYVCYDNGAVIERICYIDVVSGQALHLEHIICSEFFWYESFGPCNGIITLWSCWWTCYRITVLRIVYLLTIISNQKRPQPFSIQWIWRCCNISYTFAYKQQFRYVSVNINYRFGWWFASDSIERRETFSRK